MTINQLSDDLDFAISDANTESFWSCEAILCHAAEIGVFLDYVNQYLRDIVADPHRALAFKNQVLLRNLYRLTLLPIHAAGELEGSPSILRDSGQHCIIVNIGKHPIAVRLYHQLETKDHEIFDRSRNLAFVGTISILPGASLRLRALEDVFTITRTSEKSIFLLLSGPVLHEVCWEYDAVSLYPIRATASRVSSTRAQFALSILAEMRGETSPNSIRIIESLTAHPAHFVRWSAVNALYSAVDDYDTGFLKRFLDDPHPHIRRAAAASIDALQWR